MVCKRRNIGCSWKITFWWLWFGHSLVILLSLSLYSSLQRVLCNHALTAVESYDGATNFLLLMSVSLMTWNCVSLFQEDDFRPFSRGPHGGHGGHGSHGSHGGPGGPSGYGAYNAYISAATRYAALGTPTLYDHPDSLYGSKALSFACLCLLHVLEVLCKLQFSDALMTNIRGTNEGNWQKDFRWKASPGSNRGWSSPVFW